MRNKVKKLVVMVVGLSLIAVLVVSQFPTRLVNAKVSVGEMSQNISHNSALERTPDELDELLKQDTDVQTLLEVRNEIMQRVIDRNISVSALKTAYQSGNEQQIINLLQFSETEIKDLNYRLDTARKAIFDKFPEVAQMMKEMSASSCGFTKNSTNCKTNQLFDNFNEYANNGVAPELLAPTRCRWGPYVAALALCTLLGPVWYWVCAYAALCSFCTGGTVGRICFE